MSAQDRARRELRDVAVELAAVRIAAAFYRYLDGRKYDPHPLRQPAGAKVDGRNVGGRFAPKAGDLARRDLTDTAAAAARSAVALPEVAPAAGPAAMAVAAGVVATSRQAGLYAHFMDGQAITPILGLPGGKLETTPPSLAAGGRDASGRSSAPSDADCDEQLANDEIACTTYAAMYKGGSGYSKRQIEAICFADAKERYAECLTGKPLRPLFDGRRVR